MPITGKWDAIIGPYARLRPGTILGNAVRIGNFVETKKAVFDGAKANHLSYIGDAQVGAKANIGANYHLQLAMGADKFKTEIGQGRSLARIRRLSHLVTIGDGGHHWGRVKSITKSRYYRMIYPLPTRALQKDIGRGGGTSCTKEGEAPMMFDARKTAALPSVNLFL